MPRTNEYGLASALDLPQTNECRAYRCPRGPRSIRVRALRIGQSVPRMSSAGWCSDLNFRTSRISKTLNLNYTVPQISSKLIFKRGRFQVGLELGLAWI